MHVVITYELPYRQQLGVSFLVPVFWSSQPHSPSSTPPRPAQRPIRKPYADNQQPVQWWTNGWKPIA
jgi:hypothetical protein